MTRPDAPREGGRWGCLDCGLRFDAIPALHWHCLETGHGKLPRAAALSPESGTPDDPGQVASCDPAFVPPVVD